MNAPREVTVHYFGLIREITRESQSTLALDENVVTVRAICEALCRQYGDRMRFELFRSGGVLSLYVRVLVDGREISRLADLDTEVSPCNRVEILSIGPFSGG